MARLNLCPHGKFEINENTEERVGSKGLREAGQRAEVAVEAAGSAGKMEGQARGWESRDPDRVKLRGSRDRGWVGGT